MTASVILSAIAPQFDTDPKRQDHLDLAVLRTSKVCFGVNYTCAIALRAAHTLTLLQNAQSGLTTGSSGSIKSKKEGDLSVTFGGSSDTGVKGALGQTSYGIELQELIDSHIVPARLTGISITC